MRAGDYSQYIILYNPYILLLLVKLFKYLSILLIIKNKLICHEKKKQICQPLI